MNSSKVIKLIKETHDSYSILFEKPEGFEYKPGQYGLFEHEINGEMVKRSYSFSSSPTEKFLQITVKRMPHGKMSNFITRLHPMDNINYTGPLGKFILEDDLKEVVFIAGGSGISPFRCMIEYVLDKKLKTKITMIYGCRSPKDIILHHDLHEYVKNKNFNLFITVDTPDKDWKFHTGFIDASFIREAVKDVLKKKVYFICGPPPMVNGVKQALLDMEVKDEDIRLDAWG